MRIGDKVKYKTSKDSIQIYYGTVLGFKEGKIRVSKYKYMDYSGNMGETYISKEDLV